MHIFPCPRCEAHSIPLSDKFKAGLWLSITCKNCSASLIALPILLALVHFMYVWNVVWLISAYYFEMEWFYYLGIMLEWAVLEAMNIWYMPLAAQRAAPVP